MDAVTAIGLRIGQFKNRNTGLDRCILKSAMPLFLGEEVAPIGDDEAQIAYARLVDSGEIDFIHDSVAEREPDLAVLVQGCANARLGAGSPAGWNRSWGFRPKGFLTV